MTRKIDDIKTSDLRIQSQMKDTYIRPAAPAPDRLEKVGEALVGIEPSISKFLIKKKEEKDNFELAQGMEIWKEGVAEGRMWDDADIERGIATSDPTVFKKLTHMQKQGIYRARHERLGQHLQTHMGAWSEKATIDVEDENGGVVKTPLSMVKDQAKVIDAFLAEADRYAKEQTGGRYDPVLYADIVKPKLNEVTNVFIQQQASERKKQIELEAVNVYTGVLADVVKPYLATNRLVTDSAAIPQLSMSIQSTADNMMASGFSQKDTMTMVAQAAQNFIRNAPPDAIAPLTQAFSALPIMQSPDMLEPLTSTMNSAQQIADYAIERAKRIKEDQAEEDAFDLLKPLLSGGRIDENAVNSFAATNKEQLAAFNQMRRNIAIGYENITGMNEGAFRDIRLQLLKGEIGYKDALHYASHMNSPQIDDLINIADHNEAKIKTARAEARANANYLSRGDAGSKVKKEWSEVANVIKTYYDTDERIKTAPNAAAKRKITDVSNKLLEETYLEFEAWKTDATPETLANYAKRNTALNSIAERKFNKYAQNLATYEQNPSQMDEDPKKVNKESNEATINGYANKFPGHEKEYVSLIRTGDQKKLDKFLKNNLSQKEYQTGDAAKILGAASKLKGDK